MNYIIIWTLTSHNLYRESASWKPCGTSEGPSRTWTRRGSSGWRPRGRYGGGPVCTAGSARARGGWWWPGRRPPSPPARCWWQTSCSAWSNQCQTVSIFVKLDVQCPMSDVQYTLEIFHFITTSPTPSSLHPSKSDSNDIMSTCHYVNMSLSHHVNMSSYMAVPQTVPCQYSLTLSARVWWGCWRWEWWIWAEVRCSHMLAGPVLSDQTNSSRWSRSSSPHI